MKRMKYFFFLGLSVWMLGEILTRLFVPMSPFESHRDRASDHPYIRTDWVPNFHIRYDIEGIGGQKGGMDFDINAFGFRAKSMRTAQKPPHTLRLFFLGESTTECIYMSEEKTFPFLVEKKLAQTFPGQNFEAVNQGISGYQTADSLAVLVYKVLYYQPDVIFLMHAVNDLRYGTLPIYNPVHRTGFRKNLYAPDYQESFRETLSRLLKHSYFLTLLKWRILNRFFPPHAEKFRNKMEEYNEFRRLRKTKPFNDPAESRSLDEFVKNMEDILRIAKGRHIRLILMTEPSLYQENMSKEMDDHLWMGLVRQSLNINLSNGFLRREMNRFNDAVRQLSRTHDVELIDLEKQIPKTLDYFYDDVHYTPEGSAKVAEVIASFLIQTPGKLFNANAAIPQAENALRSETGQGTAAVAVKTYSCPMHQKIRQSGPGECPKCGMELMEMQ